LRTGFNMNKLKYLFGLIIILSSCKADKVSVIDLSGEWRFAMDTLDTGEAEGWFERKLGEVVTLPGSMASNGKGFEITLHTKWTGDIRDTAWYRSPNFSPYHHPENIRFPFWLQPDKKYTGVAWYQKEISIPEGWRHKHIMLNLERCHWETTVWLDDRRIGSQNSLSTPHQYSFKGIPGKHRVTVKVDNRIRDIDVGINSHSITDHTQSNWNGIVGDISLSVRENVYIKKLALFPDIQDKCVEVVALIHNDLDSSQAIIIETEATSLNNPQDANYEPIKQQFRVETGENEVRFTYPLGDDALLWDEFDPNLYQLQLKLTFDNTSEEYVESFGLREIKVENQQIKINNRQLFLRGTLECAIFPLTGFPSTNKEEWRRIYRTIKSYGLNHMRFHSWCPPEAAFCAADEEGIYLQVECGSWANQSTTLGDGKPVDHYIWEESKRIVGEYGNHPSFCLMAYGNEPGGSNYQAFLTDFLTYWKKQDNRRIYTGAAGWPELPENEYHNTPRPRIQGWGEELRSVINAEPPSTNFDWYSRNKMPEDGIPVISHEIGQWCVYPNFKEIRKYTGVLKAKNFELFQESLNANQMGHLADSFLLASGKLQALCYKADIEAALRTRDFGGFQLLDLHDFPGQGTALVGVLDAFWEEKGYITADEFSHFCNNVVPLARLEKRIFAAGETFTASIEVANFSNKELIDIEPHWQLLSGSGDVFQEGTLDRVNIPIGNGFPLGTIQQEFLHLNGPQKLVLRISIAGYSNSWDIWVYPGNEDILTNVDVVLTDHIDNGITKLLENGQDVLLSLGNGKVKEGSDGEVGIGFSSIFWNTAWTENQKPHTLGILCDPTHPAFHAFPTEFHSNWQWWDAMSHSDAINLREFPDELEPIVRVIDDWFANRPLGLLLEVKIGKGKLLISGIDLINNLESRPEARQLLYSLNEYMISPDFDPEVSVDIGQIINIVK
jgi:hypothetical protein